MAADTIVQKVIYARDNHEKRHLLVDVLLSQVEGATAPGWGGDGGREGPGVRGGFEV